MLCDRDLVWARDAREVERGFPGVWEHLGFQKVVPSPVASWLGPRRDGGKIGVAAMVREGVRDFLKESLHGIKALVGIDTYRKAFP